MRDNNEENDFGGRWESFEDRQSAQDDFIEYVIEMYGDQVFRIIPEQLHMVLMDLAMRLDAEGLALIMPGSTAEELGVPSDDGDIEIFVHPRTDSEPWTVSVFPAVAE